MISGGSCNGLEDFDDDHVALVTDGTYPERRASELLIVIAIILLDLAFGLGRRHMQQLATQGEFLLPIAIAEKAVVANALEAFGQDVKQESADELLGGERHRLVLAPVAIVLPAEVNLPVVDVEQAVVGDGDAMGVAADVLRTSSGPAKGGLA